MSGATHPVVVLGQTFPTRQRAVSKYDDNVPVRLVLPLSGMKGTFPELHQQLGHAGQAKTEKATRKPFWIPNLWQYVRQAVNACQQLKANSSRPSPRTPLQPIETGYPYQRLGIDFMGSFMQTRTEKRLLHEVGGGHVTFLARNEKHGERYFQRMGDKVWDPGPNAFRLRPKLRKSAISRTL